MPDGVRRANIRLMTVDLKAHYDAYYSGTSEWRELGARDKAANILRAWGAVRPGAPSPRTIEIGCGEGSVLSLLRDADWEVMGVELSLSGATAARSRGLHVETYDGGRIPIADNSFDLVVLSHVVEHLENPRLVLREAARIAPWILVEVPLLYRWRTPRDFVWDDVGHINLYDTKLIRQLLQSIEMHVAWEKVTNVHREVVQYRSGRAKGLAIWAVREAALRLAPSVACRLFVYHDTLLCRAQGLTKPA